MATTLRSYIFITFLVCCVSFAILVTSISTTSWVNATITSYSGEQKYDINFGLFLGTLADMFFLTPRYYRIRMACIAKKNVCAWSCKTTAEGRQEEINNLYYSVQDATKGCGVDSETAKLSNLARDRKQWDLKTTSLFPSTRGNMTLTFISRNSQGHYPVDQRFINLGIWGSTLASLIISIILSGVAAIAAVFNTAANPVHTIAAVPGLYLWNSLAAFFSLLTMILWGSLFGTTLRENVAIRETITGECAVNGSAYLGFSYWLILGSALMHLANIGILYFREVMLVRMPEPTNIIPTEDNDGAIFLY